MIKRLFRSLIILALFLGGCESSSSPQPAIIPTISPTGTFTPSATIAPQASLTPSLTLTPTPTSTFYPQPGQVLEPGNAGQIRQLAQIGKGSVNTLAYSPDGRYLVAGTSLGISIFETSTWTTYFVMPEESVVALSFSPKGDLLCAGLANGSIQIWNVFDRTLQRSLVYGSVTPLVAYQLSWGGNYQGEQFSQNVGDVENVVAFSPDGSLVAAAGSNFTKFWQVSDGSLKKMIQVGGSIKDIVFSPDGSFVAIASDESITQWRISDWRLLFNYEVVRLYYNSPPEIFERIAFSEDGLKLTGVSDEVMAFWRTSDGSQINMETLPSGVESSALSGDVRTLAIAFNYLDNNGLEIWGITDNIRNILKSAVYPELIKRLAFSPDGTAIAAWSETGEIAIINILTDTIIHSLGWYPGSVDKINILPNHGDLVSEDFHVPHPMLRVWDLQNGTAKNQVDLDHFGADFDSQIVFSPDESTLAIGNHTIQLWDFASGVLLQTFKGGDSYTEVHDLAFSQDGKTIAFTDSSPLMKGVVLETIKGGVLRSFEKSWGPVCFADDQKTLITHRQGLQYWNIADGKLLQTIPDGIFGPEVYYAPGCDILVLMSSGGYFTVLKNTDEQLGKQAGVYDLRNSGIYLIGPVAFSPDRNLLAVQEALGKIRIFSLSSNNTIAVINAHENGITGLNFSSDGRLLISSSIDGTIRFWGIAP